MNPCPSLHAMSSVKRLTSVRTRLLIVYIMTVVSERARCAVLWCAVEKTSLSGDARWIGCWWLGYLLVAAGILLMSIPLWFFPSIMTGHQHHQGSSLNEDTVTSHDSSRQMVVKNTWIQFKG